MADSFTGNLNLRKPEVGHAVDTWGGTAGLNADLDILDSVFQANGLSTAGPVAGVPGVGLRVGIDKTLNCEGTALFKDHTDVTKVAKLDSSLITTATTRTLQFPDEDGILATQGYLHRTVPVGTVFSGYYGTTPPTGFVFLDGRTIGDATSGATNRANADTVNLFTLFWTLGGVPSGGRGASAAADYAAHKTMALPNHSGRGMAGRDNLSGAAANVLPGWNTAGQAGGATVSATGNIHSTGATAYMDFGNIGFNFQYATGYINGTTNIANGTGGTVTLAGPGEAINVTGIAGYTRVAGGPFGGVAVDGGSGNFNIVQPTIAIDVVIAL